jgi:PAS domain S-box-containing protein
MTDGAPVATDADFRRLVELIQDYAIFMVDASGNILTWNQGAERIKGYRPDEIIGRHFSCFYTPEDVRAGKPGRGLREAARIGRFEDEGLRVRKDGTRFWADVVITALRDEHGVLRGFAKITRDVTRRREAELHLHEEQIARARAEATARQLAAIQSVTDAALSSLGLDALFHELLVRIRSLLGGDTATILLLEDGHLVVKASSGLEDERHEQVRIPMGEGFAGRIAATRAPLVVPDLTSFQAFSRTLRDHIHSLVGVPLLTPRGVVGVLHVGTRAPRDFTKEEVVLLQLVADRVARAIERRRDEIERERMVAELQQALGLRDRFLSVASHELRTPLTALLLQAQSTARAVRKAPPGCDGLRLSCRMEAMLGQVERLRALIDQILDVVRIAEGRLNLEIETVNLADLVRDVAARFMDAGGNAGTNISVEADAAVGRWDRLRLEQIVTNLLSNAVKYGEGKPITLTVRASGERVLLAVTDRGPGIRIEDQGRIFERFERLVSERNISGFGVGLWASREIAASLGGEIRVESEVGQGSTFIVDLPLQRPDQAPPQ